MAAGNRDRLFHINAFKNLGMAWKLAIVPVIAVAALLGVYLFSADRLAVYQTKVDQAGSAQEILTLSEDARAASFNYLRNGNQAAAKRVKSQVAKLVSVARDTKATLNETRDRRRMDQIIESGQAFNEAFQATEARKEKAAKFQEQMLDAARTIEQKALDLAKAQGSELGRLISGGADKSAINVKQTEAKSAWLMTVRLEKARSAEKNYIQRDDEQALNQAKELVTQVRGMAAELKQSLDQAVDEKRMTAVREAAATYRKRLDAFADNREAAQTQIEKMEQTSATLQEKARTLNRAQTQERKAVQAGMQTTMLTVSLIAALLTGALAFLISRGILAPIRSVSEAVQHIQNNNDFSHRAEADGKDEVNRMAAAVNHLVDQQARLLGEIQEQSTQVASASEELSSTSEEITQSAKSSSQRVEEVSNSAQEVNNVVQEVASNISQVSESASQSTTATKEGMETVHDAAGRINELKSSSDRVNEIMETIQGIAKKTDLLALNAAIEAANAGEQGKGFAVVADEVRKLAEQTSEATGQVNDILSQLRHQSDSSVEAMQGVESKMGEVLQAIESTDQVANQIAASAEELAATMAETTDNMGEITSNVDQVASSVTQVEQASQQLGDLANNLKSHVSQFRLR